MPSIAIGCAIRDALRLRRTAILLVCLLNPAYAAAKPGKWEEIVAIEDTAAAAADDLAPRLLRRLRSEGTKVVFLSTAGGTTQTDSWINSFMNGLADQLTKSGIRFLAEDQQVSARQRIADEQLYQQGSMQVDKDKAVLLGKQLAFQAFVTIRATVPDVGRAEVNVSSVNIQQGVVT